MRIASNQKCIKKRICSTESENKKKRSGELEGYSTLNISPLLTTKFKGALFETLSVDYLPKECGDTRSS